VRTHERVKILVVYVKISVRTEHKTRCISTTNIKSVKHLNPEEVKALMYQTVSISHTNIAFSRFLSNGRIQMASTIGGTSQKEEILQFMHITHFPPHREQSPDQLQRPIRL